MSQSVEDQRRSIESSATRELADVFAGALLDGDRERLAAVLSEGVIYESPGRSHTAGVHHGRTATIDALTTSATSDVSVSGVEVTELMVDGQRAFLAVLLSGSGHSGRFSFEIAFHVQTDGELVTGLTEYGGDQYTMDELLGTPPSTFADRPTTRSRLRPRLGRLLRRS